MLSRLFTLFLEPISKSKKGVDEPLLFCPAQAKHEAFLVARGRHYSNEAEAMKRAQELMANEEEEAEGSHAEGSQGSMELDDDGEGETRRTGRGKVPPVPPLPNNINGVGK